MNVTKLNRSGLNMSRLNASLLNASGIGAMGCKGKATMEDKIMDSMVLWYDLKKQGATNESMAENPVLRDLSGNGHDATCYNFAWSGMSGIGGYCQDFRKWIIQNGSYEELINRTYNSISIRLTDVPSRSMILLTFVKKTNYSASNYKVKVHSTNNNLEFGLRFIFDNGLSEKIINLTQNVETDIQLTEEEYTNLQDNNPILIITNGNLANIDDEITLEQLPLYPNALVSDGVDDYCLVEGLPLLNKEDGYTVIAKRKWIEIPTQTTALSSKRDIDNSIDGAFQFEYITQNRRIEMNFGVDTSIDFIQEDISWMTSQQYNNMSIRIGKGEDSDIMQLFRSIWNALYSKIALHSFILFNRDLTIDEIEWVKTNLIETEQ